MTLFYLAIGAAYVFSLIVKGWLTSTYSHWSRVRNSLDASGTHVAKHILTHNGLLEVRLGIQRGALSDHYDPRDKSVTLSEKIARESSVASAAIAAHECGHALQDKTNYGPMRLRNRLVPVASLGAQYGPWAVVGGWLSGSQTVVQIGFLLYAAALMMHLFNLPVEFDASRRARDELEAMGMDTEEDRLGTKKVLRAAAMTYVSGSATAMFHLVFIFVAFGRSLFRTMLAKPG